jgi:hypothetical protein
MYDNLPAAWAVSLLISAAGSGDVSLENRALAIEMLADHQGAGAIGTLARLAENGAAPRFVRMSAVRALANLPGGEARVVQYSKSADTALAAIAAAVRSERR